MKDIDRYNRQIILPEIGEKGQEKLSNSKVLLVGVGGLGSISSAYLCAAGIGTLRIVDFDRVSKTNLQRQVLYREDELGKPKADCARDSLERLNSNVKIEAFDMEFNKETALDLTKDCDIIVDGTDGVQVRYLMDTVAVGLNIPYSFASINGVEGQVALWNENRGPIYRDLFSEENTSMIDTAPVGVIGPVAGLAASWQVWDVISFLCGIRDAEPRGLLCFNLLKGSNYRIKVPAMVQNREKAENEFKKLRANLV